MLRTQQVANTILMLAFDEHISVTPMKLQKLMYFVYKKYLQDTGEKLFSEPFEAWKYGPVLPSVYYEFSSYQASSIRKFARTANGDVEVIDLEYDSPVTDAIIQTWAKFKNYTGIELSKLTHKENTAWREAIDSECQTLEDEDIKNEQEF